MENFTYHKKAFFLIVALLLVTFDLRASAISGSHIGYKPIDSTTYEITLTVYRDCNGLPLNAPKIEVWGKSSGVYFSTATKVATEDITGSYLNCNFISKCNGTFPFGFEKITFKDTVDVSGGDCKYTFRYQECCRHSSISTGFANSNHLNEAILNKCFGMNTSVQADLNPRILIPVGADIKMNVFIGDTTELGDSVSYRLVSPLDSIGKPVQYNGIWNPYRAITFLGFPNESLNLPAGFHFDELTNDIQFRPTVANQVSAFCVEAREWRKINGKMEVIGITRLEHEVIVVNSPNNKTPSIKGQHAIACTGAETCIEIETEDGDKNDTTELQLFGLPEGATVTYGRDGKHATAKVCWTPKKGHEGNDIYPFVAYVSDNTCLLGGKNSRVFYFTVRQSPDTSHFNIVSKTPACSSSEITLQFKGSLPISTFSLVDEDSVSYSTTNPSRLYFKGNGWKKINIELQTSAPCRSVFTDSVFITPQYNLTLSSHGDTSICSATNILMSTASTNGQAPFKYSWSDEKGNKLPDSAQFTRNVNQPKEYYAMAIDNNHCLGFDTVIITVNQRPEIDAGPTKTVCPNASFPLVANYVKGGTPTQYIWHGVDTAQLVNTQTNVKRFYYVTATDKDGCTFTDSVFVDLFPIGVSAGTYPRICGSGKLQLKAKGTAGQAPFKYTWLNNGVNADSTVVFVTSDTSFVIKIEDLNSCIAYDTAHIKVTPAVSFMVPQNPMACKGDTKVLKVTDLKGTAPYHITWDGIAYGDSASIVFNQAKDVIVEVVDANFCTAKDTIKVRLAVNPDVHIGNDRVVCKGSSQSFQAFIIGGKQPFTYLWSNGLTTDSFSTVVNTPQQYALLVVDANGCKGLDTVSVSLKPEQRANITPLPVLCEDANPVALQATPPFGTWTGAGVSSKLFVPQLAGAGVHRLQYDFISVDNCPEKGELYVVVKQTPKPDFVANKTQGIPGTTFSFTNQTTADTTYNSVWNMGEAGNPNNIQLTQNASYTYANKGKYTVKLTVHNGVCDPVTIQKTDYIIVDSSVTSVTGADKTLVVIYPNPTKDVITISTEDKIAEIKMFDIAGRGITIYPQNTVQANIWKVPVEAMKEGVYWLKIEFENGKTSTNKILIK